MPLPYAPNLPAPSYLPPLRSPIRAPGTSAPVPFIRPGTPPPSPVAAPVPPPLPVIPPLGAPTVAPAAGGLARLLPVGAAIVAAGLLGLGIGNAIYEDLLDRPFGPSLGDLFFPQLQPAPLPVPQLPWPGAQCFVTYIMRSGYDYDGFPNGQGPGTSVTNGATPVAGPITGSFSFIEGSSIRHFITGPNLPGGQRSAISIPRTAINSRPFFEFTRVDGLPDNCPLFDPESIPEPIGIPQPGSPQEGRPFEAPDPLRLPEPLRQPTPTRLPPPHVPDFPFPFPEIDAPFQPGPVPNLIPPRFPGPEPVIQPVREPEPEPRRNPDGTLRPPFIPTPTLECCPSLEIKLDKLLDRDSPEECDLTEVSDLLRDVLEKLAGSGSGNLDLTPCEGEVPITATYQGEGLTGVYSAIQAITESLNTIHTNTKCDPEPCVAAVPDWWQVRMGANRPQLSVVYRKGAGKNYHAINIPHPKVSPQPEECPLSAYTAGNIQATLICVDNSKFIVNCSTRAEAEKIALEAAAAIRPEMLGPFINLAITDRRGAVVSVGAMVPRYMQYFPEGQQSRLPQWRVSF